MEDTNRKIGGKKFGSVETVEKILTRWGIPRRYLKARLSPPVDPGNDYYIHGPVGSGKTYYLCGLLREQDGLNDCLFVTFDDMLENLKKGFNYKTTDGDGEEVIDSVLSRYKEVPVLALDDIGAGLVTDWSKAVLYQIINHRYNQLLRTYVSSNFSIVELGTIFDFRVASRLGQMCEVVILEKDQRLSE